MPKQNLTDDEFIRQMTVGTLPENQGTSGSVIGQKLTELGISPADFLLMAGRLPSAVGLALTPTPAGAGEEEELARLRGLVAQETATTEGGAAKALLQAIKSKNPAAAVNAISETAKLKPKSLTKKDIKGIAGELETSRGQLAELVKKYPQLRDASVGDVEALTKGQPFTTYRGISLLPGRELRSETMPSTTLDPNVALGIIKEAPVMMTKEGFITSTPVLRQYPGMRASETQVYVPSVIQQIRERQPGALEMKIPTRSGEKMTVEDVFKAVENEKELLADVSKKQPQDVMFNRYQGGVGDRYLMEVARRVIGGDYPGGEALVKEIGGYQTDPKGLAKEFDEFAEMVKSRVVKKAEGGEVTNDEFIRRRAEGSPLKGEVTEEERRKNLVIDARVREINDQLAELLLNYRSTGKGADQIASLTGLPAADVSRMFGASDTSLPSAEMARENQLGEFRETTPKVMTDEGTKIRPGYELRSVPKDMTSPSSGKESMEDWLRRKQIQRSGVNPRVQMFDKGGEVTDDEFIEQMTVGTRPTDQEPVPYDQTAVAQFADYLRAPVDLAQTAARGLVGSVVGPAYGVYKGVTGGKYGTPEGVREASQAGGELMQRITGEPQSQAARGVLEFIGKKAEEYKLAPIPQLMTLPVPGPGAAQYPLQAAKSQAEDIALRAVRSQAQNPDITAAQLYNAMLGKQAPGAAVVKPKGGNVIVENIDVIGGIPVRSSPIENMRPRIGSGSFASDALQQMKQSFTPDVLGRMTEESRNFTLNAMKQLEPKAALDNWIQTKLGRYIRSDMGSEADPVRKLAEEMSTKVRSDYETGLKRIAKMKDDIAKAKAQGKNTDLSEEALAAEIDKVENAYRQTSMLPVSIGPYTHPSSTNVKSRAMAGFPEEPISKSSLAKEWEEVADRQFYLHRAGDLVEADSPAFKANPWLANINPDEMVYMAPYVDEMHMFSHTLDELENALNPASGLPQNLLLKPEDMQQLSIEKAFRLVNNINDWRFQQRTAANLEEAKRAAVTYKAYPDSPRKLQWQELKAPEYTKLPPGYQLVPSPSGTALFGPDGQRITDLDVNSPTPMMQQALQFLSKNDLERALKYEGSTMRHCVGGYCEDVWSGDTQIFSLRDNKGEPHVTIEVVPSKSIMTPVSYYHSNNISRSLLDQLTEMEQAGRFDLDSPDFVPFESFIRKSPEYQAYVQAERAAAPLEISQIKGKGNVKPTSSYIPFVQDFLTTQRWSRIRDLENADVVALKPMMLKNAQDKGFNPQILFEMNGESYITKEEFNRLADKFGGINKMAAGGEVTNFIRAHA